MDRDEAIQVAYSEATEDWHSYMQSGWVPHEWVIQAILAAFQDGYHEGRGE